MIFTSLIDVHIEWLLLCFLKHYELYLPVDILFLVAHTVFSVFFFLISCCCSVAKSCPTLCIPVECSTPGFPVLHYLPELAQTHVHWVSDAIQPSHPLSSPSSPAFNLSQHRGLFQWVGCLHEVAKHSSCISCPWKFFESKYNSELSNFCQYYVPISNSFQVAIEGNGHKVARCPCVQLWPLWQSEKSKCKAAQLCPTLCDPMDYTVHGILQSSILAWVVVPFSRGSSQPRDWTQVSSFAGRFFTSWAIREALSGNWSLIGNPVLEL